MAEEKSATGDENLTPESPVPPPNLPSPATKPGKNPLLLKPEYKTAAKDFVVSILICNCLKIDYLTLQVAHILLFDMA